MKLSQSLAFCLLSSASVASGHAYAAESAYVITDFGGKADDRSDTTPAVMSALRAARENHVHTLTFPPGRYDFYPALAGERYLFVSNNDEGLKRIVFDLSGLDGFTLRGEGAHFVFHDYLVPFVVEQSAGVRLKGFSVDFARTFDSEGTIVAVDSEGMELAFSPAYPHEVRHGILVFTNGYNKAERQTTVSSGEVLYPYGSLLEFDPVKREPAFMAKDYWAHALPARELPSGHVKVVYPNIEGTPGNVMVFGPANRDVPGIVISDSRDTAVEDVDLYHCGGMGIIAQRSHNVTVERVRVTPAPGSGRVTSITADATHFVNCSGRIVLKDCLFELQTDDATNIHGIYVRISRRLGSDSVEVKLVHPQQFGFDFIVPGMKLELVHGESLITYGQAVVKAVRRINKEYTDVTLTGPLPAESAEGDVIASLDENHPEVLISGNTIRGNRARGILLGSRGKILVENNSFHTPGPAILLEGDGRFWFEQAGVRDLTVRNNIFDNCNYGIWGHGVISVGAGITPTERPRSRYNRNITIENNLFRQFDTSPIIDGYSVQGLVYRDNRHEDDTAYPATRKPAPRFNLSDSDGLEIAK